jgi:hypothetical protein
VEHHPDVIAYAKLPRTGLGNMLYVWARAAIFAHINHGQLFAASWSKFRIGPFLRREKSKRLYLGQLRNDNPLRRAQLTWHLLTRRAVHDPPLQPVPVGAAARNLYVFSALGGDPGDSFRDFIPHRDFLKACLEAQLTRRIRARLAAVTAPVVGLHVRRGDFKLTQWYRPIEYFCDRLNSVRAVCGRTLPATVFSDGTPEELAPLLNLPEVRLSPPQPDIVDMLQMSRSRLFIPSGVSTFSNWAIFLSNGVVIRDPAWPHKDARPAAINLEHFEGAVDADPATWPELLVRNVKTLGQESVEQVAGDPADAGEALNSG